MGKWWHIFPMDGESSHENFTSTHMEGGNSTTIPLKWRNKHLFKLLEINGWLGWFHPTENIAVLLCNSYLLRDYSKNIVPDFINSRHDLDHALVHQLDRGSTAPLTAWQLEGFTTKTTEDGGQSFQCCDYSNLDVQSLSCTPHGRLRLISCRRRSNPCRRSFSWLKTQMAPLFILWQSKADEFPVVFIKLVTNTEPPLSWMWMDWAGPSSWKLPPWISFSLASTWQRSLLNHQMNGWSLDFSQTRWEEWHPGSITFSNHHSFEEYVDQLGSQ